MARKNYHLPFFQVEKCKDQISQQFLVDCIIQAFPDEFHLQTLEELLQTCTTKLDQNVDVKTIFIRLMDRLADFALNSETSVLAMNSNIDIYAMFKNKIDLIVERASSSEFKNVLDLQVIGDLVGFKYFIYL